MGDYSKRLGELMAAYDATGQIIRSYLLGKPVEVLPRPKLPATDNLNG